MKQKLLSIFLLSLFFTTSIFAQSRLITGTVTGRSDGLPLPGVSVIIKGTSTGTQTDATGKFSISVPANARFLTFSFIGYSTTDIALSSNSSLNVVLNNANSQLNEVVVVGYGTQERRDVTGAVGKVQGSDIANLPAPSFEKELAGRAAGVRVTENNGLLGSAPVIRIRGTNSISSGTGPLYVIDGVPVITGNQSGVMQMNPLAALNAADIQSIEFLKDGSASAIYGSRAANGVVLVTTKKGKAGRLTVNYDMYAGAARTSKRLNVLNAAQFIEISNEKFANSGVTAPQAVATLDPNGSLTILTGKT